MDYVRKENVKELINHLVENFGQRFEDCYYVDTFRVRPGTGPLASGDEGSIRVTRASDYMQPTCTPASLNTTANYLSPNASTPRI